MKNKNFIIIIILIVLIFLFVILTLGFNKGTSIINKEPNEISKVIFSDGKVVLVEIARTPAEQARGLMNREELNENSGMLFIFDNATIKNFWMKNTLIPLDIIFIDEDLKIINIEDAVPCKKDPCGTYSSKKGAKYVLEVNTGYSTKNGIKEGDKIEFS